MPCFLPPFFALFLFLLISASVHSSHDANADYDIPSAGDKPKLRSKALILVKIRCLLLIFIGTFVAGLSPYFLKWNEGFLLLGTQFAGGVFLGTVLMHFLSDANETFQDLTEKKYPFAFMLASFGYLITMSVDFLIHYLHAKHKHADSHSPPRGGCNGDVVQLEQGQQAVIDVGRKSSIASVADTLLLIIALCFHSVLKPSGQSHFTRYLQP